MPVNSVKINNSFFMRYVLKLMYLRYVDFCCVRRLMIRFKRTNYFVYKILQNERGGLIA